METDIALAQVERLGNARACVGEGRAERAPAEMVVTTVGLAVGQQRHRRGADAVLAPERRLCLAARKAAADLGGLVSGELRALGRTWPGL
ncbi:MAG: hypothetical protein WD399_03120 [Thermoleophilaceae bacterium]